MRRELDESYFVSDEISDVNISCVHNYLSVTSYWAQGRSLEVVKRSIENSLCIGIYKKDGEQVGFARVVTDFATFAWICDVFIMDHSKGRGLGKILIGEIVRNPKLQGLKRLVLVTKDAHELYQQYGGFERLSNPERWMSRTTE
jgi:N-acetylglutamate synthase-like GNAT family acetyltransferase